MPDPKPGSGSFRLIAIAALVVFAAVVPFLGAHDNGFVLDDVPLVRDNPLIRELRGIPRLFSESYWAPHDRLNLYRPATVVSFALNHAATGPDPRGFHLANLALHAVASLLLLTLALTLGLSRFAAAASAVLFAVHPIHAEAVLEVVGRAELLATIGALAALRYHVRARGWPGHAAGAGFLLFGLFAKEVAIGALLPMILFDVTAKRLRASLRRAWPWLAVALIVYALARVNALGVDLVVSPPALAKLDNPLAVEPVSARPWTAAAVLRRYLALAAWPATLSADYSYAQIGVNRTPWAWPVIPGLVVLAVAIGALLLAIRRGRTALTIAVALTLGSWFVVSNAVTLIGTIMAERMFYLPSVGLFLLAGLALGAIRPRSLALGLTLALAIAFGTRSHLREPDFQDESTLLAKTVQTSPRSVRAHTFLALIHLREGRGAEAQERIQAALAIDPNFGPTWLAAAKVIGTADVAGALTAMRRALELDPTLVEARYSLGAIYAYSGQFERAIGELEPVLARRPYYADARVAMIEAQLGLGRIGPAQQHLQRLLDSRPDLAITHLLGGRLAESSGDPAAALASYRRALAIEPSNPHAREALARLAVR